MADVLNSGRPSPGHELRIFGRDTLAAEHEPDVRKFLVEDACCLHEIPMVFDRMFTSNQANYGQRLRNSQCFASLYPLPGVESKTVQVKTVEDDLHPVGRITQLGVEVSRSFRAANNSRGQSPR